MLATRIRCGTVATLITAALVLAGCRDDPEPAVEASAPAADEVGAARASIGRFLDRTLPAGSSGTLAAAVDGRRITCRGFGLADRRRRSAAGCDTVYDIMSMTKGFTAAAILRLEMDGRLSLDARLGEYFDDVPADKRPITLRALLTHTSGLAPALGGDYVRLSRGEFVRRALRSQLRAPPGARHLYSNAGYSMLAAVVEEASGLPYERYLRREILLPAGMRQTGYVLPDWRSAQVAVEYDGRGRSHGRPFDHPWAPDGPYWNLRGNGGMLSTAADLVRWHRALEGERILDAAAKRALFRPRVREEPGGESFYGFGWAIAQTDLGEVAWHDGGNSWSYGELTMLLDRDAMVFWITNRAQAGPAGWSFHRLGPRLTGGIASRLPLGDEPGARGA